VVLALGGACGLLAQTTQGLISGTVVNSVSGQPVPAAKITYTGETLNSTGTLQSDAAGYYFLPLLSPGMYTIRIEASAYQAQELQQLELRVAGRIQIDFKLRPLSDVWEAGQYRSVFLPGSKTIVTFFGPDVDTSRSGSFEGQRGQRGTLDTSVSYVIDPVQIGDLPLLGRDVYTMLVSLPNVNANNGTARGLGISVAGQRPSSSNYLLDGVDNDNYLITGPLNPVSPEAVQEYRISTNNYSAEYGRTAGFVANAVTRAGGNAFHGILYDYIKNDAFNAADFQDNLNGSGRLFDKEQQFGYQVGGPILKNRLFFSSALEQLISHSKQAKTTFILPTTNFIPALNIPSSRIAYQLLTKYPGPVIQSQNLTAPYAVDPPVVLDRLIALERFDYVFRGGADHLMGRLNISRTNEPDFIWSPYPAFISPLNEHTTGVATNWMHTWGPRTTSELKLGYGDDNLWWNRAHPEVPTLQSSDGTYLPGSSAAYDYRNHNRSLQPIYSMVWTRNRHVITAGVGLLFRYNSGYLTLGQAGNYIFPGIVSFAFDQPQYFQAAIDRLSPTPTLPDFNRSYSYAQSDFFVQDSFRVTSRLTLNFGLRYERYGSPQNTGAAKDALIALGKGQDFNTRLANATLSVPTGTGSEALYGADNKDFAPRIGFSWDPLGKGSTVLRGGFGIFYDAPFDNLWQSVRANGETVPFYQVTGTGSTNYLAPVASVLPSYANQSTLSNFPGVTLIDPRLRNGYAQSFFLGVQQSIGDNLVIEVTGTGALDRRLLTTDIVNRQFSVGSTYDGRPNDALPDVAWRSSQGKSDYYALSSLVRWQRRTLTLQGAYTWSHSIDNQSDPLVGDFFDLSFTAIDNSTGLQQRSAFAQQFNSNGDRGNSDFDQRQNLFLLGIWQSAGQRWWARGWQVSYMAAFRTGLPYTVYAASTQIPNIGVGTFENPRASVVLPQSIYLQHTTPAPGGVYVLNPAAFAPSSSTTQVGNMGRNALTGPGLYNVDFSLARSFSIPKLREGTVLTVRADAFNILNHANLNNPDNLIGSPTFGLETYGRQGSPSGFPAVSPVNETARQIQLMIRLQF
jgi:hypothetical protein